MKNILKSIGLFLFASNTLLAQNYLFKPNQSGPHLSVQYYNPGHQNTFVVIPGYTFNGRLTVGLLGSFTYDFEIDNKRYGTNASYMLLKEGIRKIPFSLSIDGIYTFGKYKTIDTRYNTLQIGPSIYKRINLSEKFSLIPGIRLTHDWSRSKYSGETYTYSSWSKVFQISALYNKFQITASTNKTINQNYFAIGVGFVLPKN